MSRVAALKNRFFDWFVQPRTLETGVIVLVQRRVYILPTRQGVLFAGVLLMMLLGAINYALSLGFVLTFLLVALAFNAMLFTFRNLARLQVTSGRATPVFAGSDAKFTLNLSNPGRHARHAIGLSLNRRGDVAAEFTDVPANATATISVAVPAARRGRLRPGRLTLFTRFPLGLYHAWSYVQPDIFVIVYPRPAPPGLPLPAAEAAPGIGASHGQGQEDFAGLRPYHPGDPPRHIAWKAAARGQGLYTKQFTGQAASEIWLAWDPLPPRMDTEEKLSQLTRWVLDADAQRLHYGLRLPETVVPLGGGDAHRERCLEVLALYGLAADHD
jgi:uncharacterized protein (DUF58 family)